MLNTKKSKSMAYTRILFDYAGLIPKESPHSRTAFFSTRSIVVKMGIATFFTSAVMFIAHNNIRTSFFALLVVTVLPQIGLKGLSVSRSKNFLKMLEMADELVEKVVVGKKSLEIFERADNSCLRISKLFIHMACIFPIIGVVAMLANHYILGNKPESPFQIWFPFEFSILQLPLECCFLYCCIITEFSYLISLLTLTSQVSSCIKILSHNLKYQTPFKQFERINLQIHCELIQLVNLMNTNYGGMLTIEIMFSSIQACFSSYEIVVTSMNMDGKFFMSIFTFCIVWQLPSIVCYCGQNIESEGNKMFRLMFQSSWYGRSPKDRKTVLLMMLMMSKPFKLHYKNFVFFNMERFGSVLQTTYSFIAMLRAVLF